jgi:hypothetical protein
MSRPKTTSSEGQVALDGDLVIVLRAHRVRQLHEREQVDGWVETGGLMFTERDGSPLHAGDVTDVFSSWPLRRVCRRSGCTTCVTERPHSP